MEVKLPTISFFSPYFNILKVSLPQASIYNTLFLGLMTICTLYVYTQERQSIEKEKFKMKLKKDNFKRKTHVKLGDDSAVNRARKVSLIK